MSFPSSFAAFLVYIYPTVCSIASPKANNGSKYESLYIEIGSEKQKENFQAVYIHTIIFIPSSLYKEKFKNQQLLKAYLKIKNLNVCGKVNAFFPKKKDEKEREQRQREEYKMPFSDHST